MQRTSLRDAADAYGNPPMPTVVRATGLYMIFAELEYPGHYQDFHHELLAFVRARFAEVESGLQGDSWIWITEGGEKVALDTFSSMKHQVKSSKPGRHVENVISAIKEKYAIKMYEGPELEAHEDE